MFEPSYFKAQRYAQTRTGFGNLDSQYVMRDPDSTEQLDTWAEIAGYMGISIREAQYREKSDGLPVRRGAGTKPRVWALRSELDAWRLNSGAGAPALLPVIDPVAAGAAFPHAFEESNAPAVQWGRPAVIGAAALAATAGAAKLIFGIRKPRVERAVLAGSLLTALDGLNNPIWTHRFAGDLEEPNAADLPWRVQVIDLEGGGSPGVLAVCSQAAQTSPMRAGTDEICYFAPNGRVKWTLPCRPNLLDPDGKQFTPSWVCSRLIAVPSGKRQNLWVGIHHGWRWPGCVMRVDASGAASVQFANSGYVETLCRVSGPDGEFVAVAGENNAFDRSFAAVLGVNDPPSCSPAGGPARYRFANAPAGTPRDYVLFPTTEMVAAIDGPYGHAQFLRPTSDGGFVVWVGAGPDQTQLLYELSSTAEPRNVSAAGSNPAVHRRLEAEGKLHHTWAACPEMHAPLTLRHWRRGSGWQDQPIPWRGATDKA